MVAADDDGVVGERDALDGDVVVVELVAVVREGVGCDEGEERVVVGDACAGCNFRKERVAHDGKALVFGAQEERFGLEQFFELVQLRVLWLVSFDDFAEELLAKRVFFGVDVGEFVKDVYE